MRLKKDLTQLVQSDYVPLSTTQEGFLRGGFGSLPQISAKGIKGSNILCKNPQCKNDGCSVSNNCDCLTPTPTAEPTATPTSASSSIPSLLGL
jgi:hypothetical protein